MGRLIKQITLLADNLPSLGGVTSKIQAVLSFLIKQVTGNLASLVNVGANVRAALNGVVQGGAITSLGGKVGRFTSGLTGGLTDSLTSTMSGLTSGVTGSLSGLKSIAGLLGNLRGGTSQEDWIGFNGALENPATALKLLASGKPIGPLTNLLLTYLKLNPAVAMSLKVSGGILDAGSRLGVGAFLG